MSHMQLCHIIYHHKDCYYWCYLYTVIKYRISTKLWVINANHTMKKTSSIMSYFQLDTNTYFSMRTIKHTNGGPDSQVDV